MLKNRIAKAFAKKSFVAHEHVGRAQLARFQFADKAVGLGKCTHVKSTNARKERALWPAGLELAPASGQECPLPKSTDDSLALYHLEALQDVRHEGTGKILRQPPVRGRIFLKEAGQILRHFVLLAKQVRRILI